MRSAAPRWQCSERPVAYSNSIKVCKQSSVRQGVLWHLEHSLTIYEPTHTAEKIRIDGSWESRQCHDCYLEFPKSHLETIPNTSANADEISTTSTTSTLSVEVVMLAGHMRWQFSTERLSSNYRSVIIMWKKRENWSHHVQPCKPINTFHSVWPQWRHHAGIWLHVRKQSNKSLIWIN